MYEIKRAQRLSHASVHLVTARPSLFTDHRISSLPKRAKNGHVRTICEQTIDNSPTDPFFFELMIIHAWRCDFEKCSVVLFAIASSQYLSTHFFVWPSMSQDHEDFVSASGLPVAYISVNISVAPAEILDTNIHL